VGGGVADDPAGCPGGLGIGYGNGLQERLGVGMAGVGKEFLGGGQFHQPAQVHDRNAVADVADHRKIVRNEKIGQLVLFLEVLKEVDDLCLDRDIKGGERFVADDELGLEGKSPGNAEALALAAAEFMGIAAEVFRLQPDHLHQVPDPVPAFAGASHAVDGQRFADDAACGLARIERGIGVLENDLHPSPEGQHGAAGQAGQVLPGEKDFTGSRFFQL